MKKVIFLDIDGVLNTHRWSCEIIDDASEDEFGRSFDPKAVANLARIIEKTGAEIVISSSWKFYGVTALRKLWERRRLPGTILDITPNTMSDELLLNIDLEKTDLGVCRGNEIKEWLELYEGEEFNYVIIDDMDDMLPEQEKHFVRADMEFGISDKVAQRVISILNEQDDTSKMRGI